MTSASIQPALEAELAKLNLDGYQLHVSRKSKANIEGVKFDVHLLPAKGGNHEHSHEHGHSHSHSHDDNGDHSHERNFADIQSLITDSSLSGWVKEKIDRRFPPSRRGGGKSPRYVAGRSALS